MIRKMIATIPAGLAALFLAACGDSEPGYSAPPSGYQPKLEYRNAPEAPATAFDEETYEDDAYEGLTRNQLQYAAALRQARMMQQVRQAQMQQYYRQMMAAQMLRNAYAQRSGGYAGSTGSYRRPGSAFSTYDHTGTSAYTDSNGGVVGVMTPNGSWYPGQ